MHCTTDFRHFNHIQWVAIQSEASRVSEAMHTIAEVSEASGNIYIHGRESTVRSH